VAQFPLGKRRWPPRRRTKSKSCCRNRLDFEQPRLVINACEHNRDRRRPVAQDGGAQARALSDQRAVGEEDRSLHEIVEAHARRFELTLHVRPRQPVLAGIVWWHDLLVVRRNLSAYEEQPRKAADFARLRKRRFGVWRVRLDLHDFVLRRPRAWGGPRSYVAAATPQPRAHAPESDSRRCRRCRSTGRSDWRWPRLSGRRGR